MRCPLCGLPWPRRGRTGLAPQCARCDLFLERRENDFFLGSYTLNLFATLFVAVMIALAIAFAPQVPAAVRYGVGLAGIAAFAVWFYPVSKMLWLVVDLQFRPAIEKDFSKEPSDG